MFSFNKILKTRGFYKKYINKLELTVSYSIEKRHSPKREATKEINVSQLINPEINLPFCQHGDVAFVELPADFDTRTGKLTATRTYSSTKVCSAIFLRFERLLLLIFDK